MNKKQIHYWWIDAFLLAVFIAAFFLNLTGLELHQWIGIVGGIGILLHLILHWKWVEITLRNFVSKASNRSRWYIMLDGLLLLGFSSILVTGLVISTWFNLTLFKYSLWVIVHITVSVETLVLLFIKLIFHKQWIINTSRKVFITIKSEVSYPTNSLPEFQKAYDRRTFLKYLGIVGAASLVAFYNAVNSLSRVSADDEKSTSTKITEQTEDAEVVTALLETQPTSQIEKSTESTSVASTEQLATEVNIDALTPIPTQTVAVSNSCVVRCQRKCSYPGRCNKYTDQNHNNLCDFGECL